VQARRDAGIRPPVEPRAPPHYQAQVYRTRRIAIVATTSCRARRKEQHREHARHLRPPHHVVGSGSGPARLEVRARAEAPARVTSIAARADAEQARLLPSIVSTCGQGLCEWMSGPSVGPAELYTGLRLHDKRTRVSGAGAAKDPGRSSPDPEGATMAAGPSFEPGRRARCARHPRRSRSRACRARRACPRTAARASRRRRPSATGTAPRAAARARASAGTAWAPHWRVVDAVPSSKRRQGANTVRPSSGAEAVRVNGPSLSSATARAEGRPPGAAREQTSSSAGPPQGVVENRRRSSRRPRPTSAKAPRAGPLHTASPFRRFCAKHDARFAPAAGREPLEHRARAVAQPSSTSHGVARPADVDHREERRSFAALLLV